MRSNLNILIAASIAFAAASSTARADDKAPPKPPVLRVEAQSKSDLGQQLQLALQEANNIYTRSTKAQSDMSSKWNKTLDGIAQKLK
jgi:hypothetical protein